MSAIITLVVGVGVSLLAYLAVGQYQRASVRARFEKLCNQRSDAVKAALHDYQDTLFALRAFHAASGEVGRKSFSRFVTPLLEQKPGIQALEWIPRVPAEERAAYEARARADGFKDFQFLEQLREGFAPVSHREVYFPVFYVEPYAGNESALGFDLASSPARLEALERSRDYGELVASEPITLVQETASQLGVLLFLPVFEGGTVPETTIARRRALLGFMLCVLRLGDVVSESLESLGVPVGVEVRLMDRDISRELFKLAGPSFDGDVAPSLSYEEVFEVGGRTYRVAFSGSRSFAGGQMGSWLPSVAGGSMLVITLLLAGNVLLISGRAMRVESLVGARTRELHKAKEVAEEALAFRSQFVARVSHELRSPLHSMLGLSELLAESDLDPRQRDYVRRFRLSGQSLSFLIDDLLELSRIQAEGLTLAKRTCLLEPLLKYCIELFTDRAREKGLALNLVQGEGIPAVVFADPDRLTQVLVNLLGNAVKFTATGKIELVVTLSRAGAEGAQRPRLRFEVRDTGVGIDKRDQERIFDSFTQVGGPHEGAGLGLAIARQLVELMGGSIHVESKPGRTSTFWFWIPFEEAGELPPPRTDPAPASALSATGTVKRILVVDDAEDNRLIVRAFLAGLPCEILEAGDGLVALQMMKRARFDLVLMDLNMPGMDGLSATRAIRARERGLGLAPTWIVAVTASTGEAEIQASLDAGCDDHLGKPFQKAALQQLLVRVLGIDPVRTDDGAGEVGTRHEGLTPLVSRFFEAIESDHASARRALDGDGFQEITALGHRIQGSAGFYEFTALSLLGAEFELAGTTKDRPAVEAALDAVEAELGRLVASRQAGPS